MRKEVACWSVVGCMMVLVTACGSGATNMKPADDAVTGDQNQPADLRDDDGTTADVDLQKDVREMKTRDESDPDLALDVEPDQGLPDAQEDLLEETQTPDVVETSTPEVVEEVDTFQCPAEPPAATQELPCLQWQCEPAAEPQCWDCLFVPQQDGLLCELAGVGVGTCVQGSCVPTSDPAEQGPLTVETVSYTLELSGGFWGTDLPLTIYLPQGTGPYPVVIFHHGFQLKPEDYASYGQHLAQWGIIVVMPEMPGGVLGLGAPNHVELKGYLSAVIDWAIADAGAGTVGTLKGRANGQAIGLAGHSMGGKISVFLATQDSRPRAVFTIDAVDAAGGPVPLSEEDYPSVAPEMMATLAIPSVFLGETTNATCEGFLCQACAPEAENFHQYFLAAPAPSIEIEVVGANHMSFLDDPNCGITCSVCSEGSDDATVTRHLTQTYMTAFFLMHLTNQPAYANWLTGASMQADVDAGLVKTTVKAAQ